MSRKNWKIVNVVTDFLHVMKYCSLCVMLEGDYTEMHIDHLENDRRDVYLCTNPLFGKKDNPTKEFYFTTSEQLIEYISLFKDIPVSYITINGLNGNVD